MSASDSRVASANKAVGYATYKFAGSDLQWDESAWQFKSLRAYSEKLD